MKDEKILHDEAVVLIEILEKLLKDWPAGSRVHRRKAVKDVLNQSKACLEEPQPVALQMLKQSGK